MANVNKYSVLFYGTDDGYGDTRAQISLFNGARVVGYVRFHDDGMPFPADTESGGRITMHLPSSMFENVIDVLRNEEPIRCYYASSHGFLGTSTEEPVGEGE